MADFAAECFDTDAFIAAVAPPSIKVKGKVYTGRLVSWEEMLPLHQKFQNISAVADANKGSPLAVWTQMEAMVRELCDLVGIPPGPVLSLPPGAMLKACKHFFVYAMAVETADPTSILGNGSHDADTNAP